VRENTRFGEEFRADVCPNHNLENAQKPRSKGAAGGCRTRYVFPLVLMLLLVDDFPCLDRV